MAKDVLELCCKYNYTLCYVLSAGKSWKNQFGIKDPRASLTRLKKTCFCGTSTYSRKSLRCVSSFEGQALIINLSDMCLLNNIFSLRLNLDLDVFKDTHIHLNLVHFV